jgi:beta-lactamase regulating signal transducer with metallopeptidase domain
MNSWLLFLLKSTLVLSLLYLFFRLLLRNETFFKISRTVLLFIVFASVVIPFIYLPQSNHPIVSIKLDPIFQGNTIIEKPVQIDEATPSTYSSITNSNASQPIVISTKTVLLFIYLTGVSISLLLFVYSIFSVLQLFRKSRKTTLSGIQVMIHNADIPAFSFRKRILISRHDYETNAEAILTHELSHIRQGHFYDLMLMEMVKIIYWFNPLIYRMGRDLKDIHEFQADEHTLNSGIDSTNYQLLIIQKCVGHQSFALANSFNHCQIKNRITMMNKSKTSKAWRWKVATFLPLLALLLMAFGKRSEIVTPDSSLPVSFVAPSEPVQVQYGQFKQKIEIKKDGNYIDKKLCSLQEIADKGQEWYKKRYPDNTWIFLLIDESIPLSRVDEVREALTHSYWVVQATAGSDDLVYFSGDVSDMAKFKQGSFNDWISSQLNNYPEIKSKALKYTITYSFIIGKNGKVRDGHVIKGTNYPEINAAYEKILTQIPDWEPAKRSGESVSVYNHIMSGGTVVTDVVKK